MFFLTQIDLEKVHKIQMEIALEVKRICEKNNINYFIIAGTLLGAVRHRGFIPWDDDMDIGMLREDYERFLKVCKRDLSNEYFLQTMDTDRNFGLPMAKLRREGTRFIEKNSEDVKMHNGIYIDIFPFDNSPNSRVKKQMQAVKTYVLKRSILAKNGYNFTLDSGVIKKVIYKIIKVFASLIPVYKQKQLLKRQMQKYNDEKTTDVVVIGGAYGYHKETIQRKWVSNLTTIKFEGIDLPCPSYYEDYLTYFYGDYLTPPPEEKRDNRHGIIEVSFGESNNGLP